MYYLQVHIKNQSNKQFKEFSIPTNKYIKWRNSKCLGEVFLEVHVNLRFQRQRDGHVNLHLTSEVYVVFIYVK